MKFCKKEKLMFWSGALVGIVGGFIGNILSSYMFQFSKKPNLIDAIAVILFTIIFLTILFFINKQIKKNSK